MAWMSPNMVELFGGEGLFLTVVKGPGKFVVQTMQLPDLARRLQNYMTISNK